MEEFFDVLKFLGGILLSVVLGVFVIFTPVIGVMSIKEKMYCNEVQEMSPEYNFHWGFWTGCMIELDDGSWGNASNYLDAVRMEVKIRRNK